MKQREMLSELFCTVMCTATVYNNMRTHCHVSTPNGSALFHVTLLALQGRGLITAWAVALSCYISHGAMHRKKADFDPQGAKTHEPILMKLGIVDYVRDPTPHDSFGGGSSTWVVSAHT